MNRVVIDFPPGACGHFLSRVLNLEYNFKSGNLGEFHSLSHNYKSMTTSQENFPGIFDSNTASNENVICLHNFNNFDLSKKYPTHKLISIYIDSKFEIFLQNFYIKAIGSNANTLSQYHESVVNKFTESLCPFREEFYNMYQWLPTSKWSQLKTDYVNFPFSYIYSYEQTMQFLIEHNFVLPDNFKEIHADFLLAQTEILNKGELFNSIKAAVIKKMPMDIPIYLTDIDRGIISGMLYQIIGADITNVNSLNWFTNTQEILNYIQ
jgi:hypothetical protein